MAKSHSFFGLRRGSTKSLTFQVNKGQQITKDRVYEVANPRTTQQMAQRLRFACAVQFFKHANQALFKYAFEDKGQLESDYNAFIRHNALNAGVVSRYMLERNYPAMGAFQLTQGSLGDITPTVYVEAREGDTPGVYYNVKGTKFINDEDATVGDFWKQFLAAYPSLQNGDIVTLVEIGDENTIPVKSADEAISKFALCYAEEGVVDSPRWLIKQFKIDVNSTANLIDEGSNLTPFWTDVAPDNNLYPIAADIREDSFHDDRLHAIALIVSRPISSSEVKVTSSSLCCNPATALALDVAKSTPWIEWCANTYEDSQLLLEADAILKGEIVESTETFEAVISDPTAKKDGRKVATINKAQNVNPSGLRVLIDISGAQSRLALEEDWIDGQSVLEISGAPATDINVSGVYAHFNGKNVNVFVPLEGGLVKASGVVAYSSTASFKLVGLSN